MKDAKNVLILFDGHDSTRKVAARIASRFSGTRSVVMDAADFAATDLLPADAFFFGCEKPKPSSFVEFERVMKSINLAGKPCGLFSLASKDAIEYLRGVVRDAELRVNPEPLLADAVPDERAWVETTLRRS